MKAPAGLLLEVDSKPIGDKPMGGEPSSDFEAALHDAFEAAKGDDPTAFIDAMSAAITAKCAEMYAGDDEEDA